MDRFLRDEITQFLCEYNTVVVPLAPSAAKFFDKCLNSPEKRLWLRNIELVLCAADMSGSVVVSRGQNRMHHPGPPLYLLVGYRRDETGVWRSTSESPPVRRFHPIYSGQLYWMQVETIAKAILLARAWSWRKAERSQICLGIKPAIEFHFNSVARLIGDCLLKAPPLPSSSKTALIDSSTHTISLNLDSHNQRSPEYQHLDFEHEVSCNNSHDGIRFRSKKKSFCRKSTVALSDCAAGGEVDFRGSMLEDKGECPNVYRKSWIYLLHQ